MDDDLLDPSQIIPEEPENLYDWLVALTEKDWFRISIVLVIGVILLIRKIFFGKKRVKFESKEYWEQRYDLALSQKKDRHFDWFYREGVADLVTEILPPGKKNSIKVLDLGCGSSLLGEDLCQRGYDVTCTDFSGVCIRDRKRYNNKKSKPLPIKYVEADATNMKDFKDQSFNIIVEKATFDSMISPRDFQARSTAKTVIDEVHRLLKPGGVLVSISHCNQEVWDEYWKHDGFDFVKQDLTVQELPDKKLGNMNAYIFVFKRL